MTLLGLAARALSIDAWTDAMEPEVSLIVITLSPVTCSTNVMLGTVYRFRTTPCLANAAPAQKVTATARMNRLNDGLDMGSLLISIPTSSKSGGRAGLATGHLTGIAPTARSARRI